MTASETTTKRPALLCILDGWGHRADSENNAFALADTPTLGRWMREEPMAFLETSGEAVGLPEGQMGNSEVGHMTLGSGRVILQDLPRIDHAIKDGSLAKNSTLKDLIARTKSGSGRVHVMGLMSPGGVHSHQDHLIALAGILSEAGLETVIHPFLDGRDTPPQSALDYAAQVEDALSGTKGVSFGTVSGRYYAMDRDKRWDRIELAYRALVQGEGTTAPNLKAAISASYEDDVTDEFVVPTVLDGYSGMAQGDGLLMINFRADRAREILTAMLDPAFDGFIRSKTVDFSAAAGMVEYSSALAELLPALFPPENVTSTLGEIAAKAGRHQLRIAETEKYAHVTFFFNGGKEEVYENEDRILVPSPKVATYDLQPEMSAPEVTDKLVEAIGSGKYDLIICNYANPDMVGHTGVLPAAIKAMETVDSSLGRLEEALEEAGGVMLLTADHGNLELMVDPDSGAPHTAHTTFEVPVLLIGAEDGMGLENGTLADVAPTLCALMGLDQPAEMTGHSLLQRNAGAAAGKKAPRSARAGA